MSDELSEVLAELQTDGGAVNVLPPAAPDLPTIYAQHDRVTEEVIASCRHDREEAQQVISMLRHQVEHNLAAGVPVPRQIVEGLVQALDIKSSINATALKALDVRTRLLTGSKATVINNNVTAASVSAAELQQLLAEPLDAHDEC